MKRAIRGMYVAGIIGILGFGAMQVTARPAAAAMRTCTAEVSSMCDDYCKAEGYSYGWCYEGASYQCFCV